MPTRPSQEIKQTQIRMNFKQKMIKLDKLLLDPNNYRFLDNEKYKKKLASKYHVSSVQEATLNLLENTHAYQLKELKGSIFENGFVPIERIVVKAYRDNQDLFVVVEGNRRVAALKALVRDNRDGVIGLTKEQVKQFSSVPCVVLEAEAMEEAERTIMGIRHIAGTKEWGAYQQAQLIHELIDVEQLDSGEVAERLGMTKVETNRRYRAMSALKQMEKDEEYSEHAHKEQYRLFHELVSQPVVREAFGWDHASCKFEDITKARQFFELIAPQTDGAYAKLLTYGDVRKLRKVVENPRALELLLDPDSDFREALAEVEVHERRKRDPGSVAIESFFQFVDDFPVNELKDLTEKQVTDLEQIASLCSDLVDTYRRLTDA